MDALTPEDFATDLALLPVGDFLVYHVGCLAYDCEERAPNGIHGYSEAAKNARAIREAAWTLTRSIPRLASLTQKRISDATHQFPAGEFEYRITKL